MTPDSAPPLMRHSVPVTTTGAPVLCLHGLFAGSWVFDDLLPRIAERGHPAAALSFRGHPPDAPSNAIGSRSVMDYVEEAADAASSMDRPIVIGHSMGGLVALILASRQLVRAAVLVSPAPPRGISVLSPPILARMARYLPALLLSRPYLPIDRHLDELVLNRVPEPERESSRRRFVPDSGRASREMALGLFKVSPDLVRVPLLVVGSDDDRFIPLGVTRRVAKRYGAPLHIARNHGHFLFAEPGWRAEADVILNWIDALPPAVRATAPATIQERRTNSSPA